MAQAEKPQGERPASWARDHMANERTLLAWIRTALAFMGFGVAIAKLSVLLQIDAIEHPEIAAQLPDDELSRLVGAALVALGAGVTVLGALQTRRWARQVSGERADVKALLATAGMTVVTSIGLLVYLWL